MVSPIFLSRPAPGFSFISIIRGLQLSILGAYRVFIDPNVTSNVLPLTKKLIILCLLATLIYVCVNIPFFAISSLVNVMASCGMIDPSSALKAVHAMDFLEFHIMNLNPFMIMSLRYLNQDLDQLFWKCIAFTDEYTKHKRPSYSRRFATTNYHFAAPDSINPSSITFTAFLVSYLHGASYTLATYLVSRIPYIGVFAFPWLTFRNLYKSLGSFYAFLIGLFCCLLPKDTALFVANSILGSRRLMKLLLEPYFDQLPFNASQLNTWYLTRIGCLYGFSIFYYMAITKLPFYLAVFAFTLAQGATALLVTKVTQPPPELSTTNRMADLKLLTDWMDDQCSWNKNYYEELDQLFGEVDYSVPGAFVAEKPS